MRVLEQKVARDQTTPSSEDDVRAIVDIATAFQAAAQNPPQNSIPNVKKSPSYSIDHHRFRFLFPSTLTRLQPRVDFTRLTTFLNKREAEVAGEGVALDYAWTAPRLNDTGPLLRIDRDGAKLSKLERYGHPFMRQLKSSRISEAEMVRTVKSYLAFGLATCPAPRAGGFAWDELNEMNKRIDWDAWEERMRAELSMVQ